MRLARGTAHIVGASALLTLLAAALEFGLPGIPGGLATVAFLALLTLFLANFFRDPERALGEGLVSPADGKVTEVREAEDGGAVVVIFMNVHDVHVNRAPCDGTVLRRAYAPGSHMPAWKKDSERNERMTWDLDTPHGPVRVVQIAGLLARRIVPYMDEGARVRKGDRLGMIRLGSRVDVHLPPGLAPAVEVGDKVLAGTTTLAAA